MKINDKRLIILSEIEEFAFYGLPDFDDEQRLSIGFISLELFNQFIIIYIIFIKFFILYTTIMLINWVEK